MKILGLRQLLCVLMMLGSFTVSNAQDHSTSYDHQFVVVIDAGHGGKDPGNLGNSYVEKTIALEVALETGKVLEKRNDMKILYTRKTDEFIPLMGRADVANKADADLFVSIHCNSFREEGPHGTETYVLGLGRNKDNLEIAMKENSVIYYENNYKVTYDGFDPQSPASYIGMSLMQAEYLDQSILLADYIQKEFTNSLHRYDRGVKKAHFLVLRETYMPSVLVEIGFLTNDAEGKYLSTNHGQEEIASAIAAGVVRYKSALNLNDYEIKNKKLKKNKNASAAITFRVQIAAGSKPLETASYNFNGLQGVTRKKEGKLYKYYLGETSDYLEIQEVERLAQEKGYLSAYIVAFKDGQKMSVSEALKTMAN